MKSSRAIAFAILLPLLTIPFDLSGEWFGVPLWAGWSLLMTGVVALTVAVCISGWWDRLADEAEGGEDGPVGR